MKSGKQKRAELKARKLAKREAAVQKAKLDALARGVAVDPSQLRPNGDYLEPDFVERGYYVDEPFECRDCGEPQTWTAAQQKWWYEVAKGSIWSTAIRCRPCRQRERARREEARRVHREGLARRRREDA